MTDDTLQEALVRPSKSLSIIWLLPLIALLIGAWLLYKTIADAPVKITIEFASGTGIEIGKTKVMYEGIVAGVVTDVRLDQSDLKGVTATVEMDHRVEALLRETTQFWLVKPEISLSGVTGLETIVSGNYIGVKIGSEGGTARHFKALEKPPVLDASVPGLHLKLHASDLGSIYIGAPVMFRKIVVGDVQEYELDAANDRVTIRIHIRTPHDELVTRKTRFWNSSGFRVRAGLDGVDVRMDSLLSVVKGGITFDATDISTETAASDDDEFRLYGDYASAQRGVRATLRLPSDNNNISKGTKILYKGFEAGEVRSLKLSDDHKTIEASISLPPEMEEHLNTGARFWVVKPQISLSGISGLDTLLKGNYIEMDIGSGEPVREFVALKSPPALDDSKPGLRLRLETAELGSLTRGSPVLYRKIQVGSVQGFALAAGGDGVLVDVLIEPEYRSLVTSHTRFWNASGVSVSGSLGGVTLRTESLASIIQGGVAFFNPPGVAGEAVKNGAVFSLHEDHASAQEQGTYIDIHMTQADGVEPGTAIRFQGIAIGTVKSVTLKPDLSGVSVRALLHQQPALFAREGSVFWLVAPVLSITGAANLETLVKGKYFEVVPGNGGPQRQFSGQLEAPTQTTRDEGLNIQLSAPRLGSIREGLAVYYREVPVGKVTGYRLGDLADRILVFVNIQPRYAPLVRQGTRFWNTSGISVDVGLFKGAKIRTESLESILAGGIAFATPDNGNELEQARNGDQFSLHTELDETWLLWQPQIALSD